MSTVKRAKKATKSYLTLYLLVKSSHYILSKAQIFNSYCYGLLLVNWQKTCQTASVGHLLSASTDGSHLALFRLRH